MAELNAKPSPALLAHSASPASFMPTALADASADLGISIYNPGHRGLCGELLRRSMAAIITSVVGYCMFIPLVCMSLLMLIAIPTSALGAISMVFGLTTTIMMTVAGQPLVNKLERWYSLPMLCLVRKRARSALILSCVSMALLTLQFFVLPAIGVAIASEAMSDSIPATGDYTDASSQAFQAVSNPGVLIALVMWVAAIFSSGFFAYFIACTVISALLFNSAKQAIALVSTPPSMFAPGMELTNQVGYVPVHVTDVMDHTSAIGQPV